MQDVQLLVNFVWEVIIQLDQLMILFKLILISLLVKTVTVQTCNIHACAYKHSRGTMGICILNLLCW